MIVSNEENYFFFFGKFKNYSNINDEWRPTLIRYCTRDFNL